MSNLIGEHPDGPGYVQHLSPSDLLLHKKIGEAWQASIIPLSIILILTTFLEGYSHSRANTIQTKINTALAGSAPTAEVYKLPASYSTAAPLQIENEIKANEQFTGTFTVGQSVVTHKNNVERRGVIEQVFRLTDDTNSSLSFVIVNFDDGTWGGFDPHQVTAVTK